MPPAAPSDRELDAYRDQADRFIAELDEEFYLHYAGLKDDFDIVSIYERHANLTTLDQANSIALAVNGGSRVRELWRFACEGYLGNLTRDQAQRIARTEAELSTTVDGEPLPFRMLRPTIANEADRPKRLELERRRQELTAEHLNPLHLQAAREQIDAVHALGSPTYRSLYERFGYDLDGLADQCRQLLASTERLWETWGDRLFRERTGVGLDEAGPADVPRVFRAEAWDTAFPGERMIPALEATLGDLGVDLRSQENVILDVEQRPKKDPRAFCAPIEVPDKVMLVIQPQGGADDWRALFHEAGHAEHFGHTSRDLAMEEKRLGDNAVTEGWAMLLEHLTSDPAWLTRRLDFPRPDEYAREGAVNLLYFVRRYSAKLLYELEFHATPADEIESMRPRYVEILGDALKIDIASDNYLSDIDSGYYVTSYLRSWAFEAQLRGYLREKFGNAWFTSRDAGGLIRELWSEGQRLNADEMLKDVTGATLTMEAVGERISEVLS
ncbi:MAG TPA: hypothetical protein VFV20_05380 [Candidatus Limnocylindria bacterium]|nr:hypothetical protein [Candidatus Limnocylindria bacterium]